MIGLRRTCSRCQRRRKIVAYWPISDWQVCRECAALTPGTLAYSLHGHQGVVKDVSSSP